jgi:hypothetical protein
LAAVYEKQGWKKHCLPAPLRAREGHGLSKTNPAGNPGPPPEARPDGRRGAERSGDGAFAGRDEIKIFAMFVRKAVSRYACHHSPKSRSAGKTGDGWKG